MCPTHVQNRCSKGWWCTYMPQDLHHRGRCAWASPRERSVFLDQSPVQERLHLSCPVVVTEGEAQEMTHGAHMARGGLRRQYRPLALDVCRLHHPRAHHGSMRCQLRPYVVAHELRGQTVRASSRCGRMCGVEQHRPVPLHGHHAASGCHHCPSPPSLSERITVEGGGSIWSCLPRTTIAVPTPTIHLPRG
jgi:hypothetical protein